MIGVVLPTRGLVFTRVEKAIEEFRKEHDIRVYRTSGSPIPTGHNALTEQALADGCDYIWFIEEDTVPPAASLERMLQVDADIACVDYGVGGWGCVTKNTQGEILWCGLGCTLVKRRVFEALKMPYFRVDKALKLPEFIWTDLPQTYIEKRNYGGLDIWFCCEARRNGFKIVQVPGECEHLQLIALGERENNHGLHHIERKPKIEKHQIL